MKLFSVALAIALTIVAPAECGPNLTGTWTLDFASSKLAPGEPTTTSMQIEQDSGHLAIVEVIREDSGQRVNQLTYTFGDAPVQDRSRLVTLPNDGSAIRFVKRQDSMLLVEEWTVSEDGSELFIHRRGGHSAQFLVFRRSVDFPCSSSPQNSDRQ